MMDQKFCQSCAMPLTQELKGTEKNGGDSEDYCSYCYQDGAFTGEMTMEEMVDFCVPHMVEANADMTPEKAKAAMMEFFPTLKRWSK